MLKSDFSARSTIKLYQILTTTTTPTHSSPAATPPPPPLDPATPHLPSSCSKSSFILLCPLSCLCYFYCHSLLSTLPPSYTTTSVLSSACILQLACPTTRPPSSWSSPSPASASTSATTFSLHRLIPSNRRICPPHSPPPFSDSRYSSPCVMLLTLFWRALRNWSLISLNARQMDLILSKYHGNRNDR